METIAAHLHSHLGNRRAEIKQTADLVGREARRQLVLVRDSRGVEHSTAALHDAVNPQHACITATDLDKATMDSDHGWIFERGSGGINSKAGQAAQHGCSGSDGVHPQRQDFLWQNVPG